MAGSVTVLFPGQGAFDGAALRQARARYPEIDQVFAAIDTIATELCGRTLSSAVFDGSAEIEDLLLDEPWVSQLAIFGGGVAAYEILRNRGLEPDLLMGHSLGEIAALTSANVFSIADGARIVIHRTRAAAGAGAEGYLAALSTTKQRAQLLVDLIGERNLAVAVLNQDNQVVLSGPAGAMDTALSIATQLGITGIRLQSPFPFHSPAMQPAVARFAESIREIPRGKPDVPVYSPILGAYYDTVDHITDVLAQQMVQPVAFADALRSVSVSGTGVFIEAGGKTALSKLTNVVLEGNAQTFSTVSAGRGVGDVALDATLQTLRAAGHLPPSSLSEVAAVLAPGTDPAIFAAFWAEQGEDIVALVGQQLEEFSRQRASSDTPTLSATDFSTVQAQAPQQVNELAAVPEARKSEEPPATASPGSAPDRDTLADEVRSVYAAVLEYPEEVFTDDVLLEAELGVDSLKRVELLRQLTSKYNLPDEVENFKPSDFDTFGKVVDYIYKASSGQSIAVAS